MGPWIRIQEGKNDPQKYKKLISYIFCSAGCFLLRAEGFSCSLEVIYGGLGISKLLTYLFLKDKFVFSCIYSKNSVAISHAGTSTGTGTTCVFIR
jgi:hypothetical protein